MVQFFMEFRVHLAVVEKHVYGKTVLGLRTWSHAWSYQLYDFIQIS